MATFPQALIPGTEVHILSAQHVNQAYRISIALPPSYHSQPNKVYPTIYLLDANWYFGLVTETTRIMQLCEEFLEVIIVGIGYPVDEPLDHAFKHVCALRERDMTPIVDEQEEQTATHWTQHVVHTGGAHQFLTFIQAELIPFIEAIYRCSAAERVLVGHSSGGLFTLYTLFQAPDLFHGYVAASPYLQYGMKQHRTRVIFSYEEAFAQQQRDLSAIVYLAVGALEESVTQPYVSNLHHFESVLRTRNYAGLSLLTSIIPNCDHCQSVTPAFHAGLLAVIPHLHNTANR